MFDEKKVAGASYVLSLYKDIQALTDTNAQYLNYVLEVEASNRGMAQEDLKDMDEEQKRAIISSVQNLRFYANKCYVQYMSLKDFLFKNAPKKDEKTNKPILEVLYETKIKKDFILDRDTVELFVIEFNKLLLNEVIKSVLESSEEYITQVYGQQTGVQNNV